MEQQLNEWCEICGEDCYGHEKDCPHCRKSICIDCSLVHIDVCEEKDI